MISFGVTPNFSTSTSLGMRIQSSSSVKPAYSLKQSKDVTFNAILNPEVRESRDTDETPVIKVLAIQPVPIVEAFMAA